jgi:hypothetical protein
MSIIDTRRLIHEITNATMYAQRLFFSGARYKPMTMRIIPKARMKGPSASIPFVFTNPKSCVAHGRKHPIPKITAEMISNIGFVTFFIKK